MYVYLDSRGSFTSVLRLRWRIELCNRCKNTRIQSRAYSVVGYAQVVREYDEEYATSSLIQFFLVISALRVFALTRRVTLLSVTLVLLLGTNIVCREQFFGLSN